MRTQQIPEKNEENTLFIDVGQSWESFSDKMVSLARLILSFCRICPTFVAAGQEGGV